MPRSITASFRKAVEANFSGDVDLVFLTISHPSLSDDIRVVMDNRNYSYNGHTYIGFPFDIQLLSDDEQPPKAQLAIQNVDSGIGEAIRTLVSPPRLKIELLSSADFNPYVFRDALPNVPLSIPSNLVDYAGLETGDFSEFGGSNSGSSVVDTTFAFRGNNSLRFSGTGAQWRELVASAPTNEASLHCAIYLSGFTTGLPNPIQFRTAADASIIELKLDTSNQIIVLNVTTATSTNTGIILTPGQWHIIDLLLRIDAVNGFWTLYVDDTSKSEVNPLNTGTNNISRAFFGTNNTMSGNTYYDEMYLFDANIVPNAAYVADKLFLTNVSVDVATITGTIEGWDYLQRVWPGVRARQSIFPGLFK